MTMTWHVGAALAPAGVRPESARVQADDARAVAMHRFAIGGVAPSEPAQPIRRIQDVVVRGHERDVEGRLGADVGVVLLVRAPVLGRQYLHAPTLESAQ